MSKADEVMTEVLAKMLSSAHCSFRVLSLLVLKRNLLFSSTITSFKKILAASLVVQWLRLCAPNAGVLGSISGELDPHMLQLRPHAAK